MFEGKYIEEAPSYIVTPEGEVHGLHGPVKIQRRENGSAMVYIYNDAGKLIGRSLARLVAEAFLPPSELAYETTPIHLNLDKMDCHVENLRWRTRSFAVNYHKQINVQELVMRGGAVIKILETGEEITGSLRPYAMRYGLMEGSILDSSVRNSKQGIDAEYPRPLWHAGVTFVFVLPH